MNKKIETRAAWDIRHHRVYEEFIFIYSIILIIFLMLGMLSFGFELSGFSQVGNLGVTFLWYLLIATGMYFTPVIHQWFFRKNSEKHQETVRKKIEKISDEKARKELQNYYEINGRLPPNRRQTLALTVLFWILLFELFFINAWVKGDDHHLVWQPFWIDGIWQWMHGHIMTEPPLFKDWKFFSVDDRGTTLVTNYASAKELLSIPLAKSGLIFHFWRVLTFIPVLVCFYVVLSQAIDWLGMTKVSPANIQGVGRFIWSSVATLVLLLVVLITFISVVLEVTELSLPMLLSSVHWLDKIGVYVMLCINCIFAFKLLQGWGVFWKRVWLKFIGS